MAAVAIQLEVDLLGNVDPDRVPPCSKNWVPPRHGWGGGLVGRWRRATAAAAGAWSTVVHPSLAGLAAEVGADVDVLVGRAVARGRGRAHAELAGLVDEVRLGIVALGCGEWARRGLFPVLNHLGARGFK